MGLAQNDEQEEESKCGDHNRNRGNTNGGVDPALVGSASEAHVLGNSVPRGTLLMLVLLRSSDLGQVL